MRLRNNFRNLSPNNPNNYDVIEGLLYVPILDSSANATCEEALSSIPDNVTTLASFPHQDYPLVALFPWTNSSECTDAYLAQTRADAARGVITYQLVGEQPPDSGDSSWLLNGSDAWKTENQAAIYAVSAMAGTNFMTQLALYSGNMTSVPNGQQLAQQYDGRDFPRLFAQMELQGQSNVPSLWIFLIIVLAVLLGIVIVASIIMHIIQRHQRTVLQRRLERGEVDLETLGIKKMNVPQEKIDEMPRYVFTNAPDAEAIVVVPSSPKSSKRVSTQPQTSFSQTVCPICLDDFVAGETEVRELPCKHIFHPECIDLFLRDNSSLCPMCKKSALPPGYCPVKVTNLMVRRERLVRRMRERRRQGINPAVNRSGGAPPVPTTKAQHAWLWVQRKFRFGNGLPSTPAPDGDQLAAMRERRQSLTNSVSASNPNDIEMGQPVAAQRESVSQPLGSGINALNVRRQTIAVPPNIAAQGAAARRAWRRERLAQQQEQAYDQQAQTVREVDEGRPLWRRVVGRVAPGLE